MWVRREVKHIVENKISKSLALYITRCKHYLNRVRAVSLTIRKVDGHRLLRRLNLTEPHVHGVFESITPMTCVIVFFVSFCLSIAGVVVFFYCNWFFMSNLLFFCVYYSLLACGLFYGLHSLLDRPEEVPADMHKWKREQHQQQL